MKNILRYEHEGIWMSEIGHRAYLRGERPRCLIKPEEQGLWEPTVEHHIGLKIGGSRYDRRYFRRILRMFYRKPIDTGSGRVGFLAVRSEKSRV